MKTIEMTTLKAAHELLTKEQEKSNGFVKLEELQNLCKPRKHQPKQNWRFFGDWKRHVLPFYV
jgi:hypothetical protein